MGRYAKAKGRKFQNFVKSLLESTFNHWSFKTAIMGESGSDIKIFPEQIFSVEVKHHKNGLIRRDDMPSETVLKQARELMRKENSYFCLIVLKENYKSPRYFVLYRNGKLRKLEDISELREIVERYK